MSNNQYETGKEYTFNHQRKGTFSARVVSEDDVWVEVEITSGQAHRISRGGPNEAGEQITIRFSS